MKPSRELQAILDLALKEDEFKKAIHDSSMEVKDEYLRFILVQHSQRRFVDEERQRHAERIEAEEAARRHREAIDENRSANRLSKLAIGIAVGAFVVTILAWWFPREPQASDRKESNRPQAVAPAPAPAATASALSLTNAQTTNQLPQTMKASQP